MAFCCSPVTPQTEIRPRRPPLARANTSGCYGADGFGRHRVEVHSHRHRCWDRGRPTTTIAVRAVVVVVVVVISEGVHADHPSSKTSQLPFTPPRSTRGIEEGKTDVPPVSDATAADDDDDDEEGGAKALVR